MQHNHLYSKMVKPKPHLAAPQHEVAISGSLQKVLRMDIDAFFTTGIVTFTRWVAAPWT